MNSQTRAVPAMIGLIFTVSVLVFPIRVEASEEGRRNTALGLGAAAAYLLLTKRDKVPGLVAAGAAAYAYKRYDDAFRERKDRERYWGYRYGDDRYYRNGRHDDDRYYRSRRDRGDRIIARATVTRLPAGAGEGRKGGTSTAGAVITKSEHFVRRRNPLRLTDGFRAPYRGHDRDATCYGVTPCTRKRNS